MGNFWIGLFDFASRLLDGAVFLRLVKTDAKIDLESTPSSGIVELIPVFTTEGSLGIGFVFEVSTVLLMLVSSSSIEVLDSMKIGSTARLTRVLFTQVSSLAALLVNI
jgi:hypothetical protein